MLRISVHPSRLWVLDRISHVFRVGCKAGSMVAVREVLDPPSGTHVVVIASSFPVK